MIRSRRARLLMAVLVGTGCASAEFARPLVMAAAPAEVVVEVLRGFDAPPPSAPLERVELLLDLSSSMRAQTPAGVRGSAIAQSAARRLVQALPASTSVGLSALGHRRGECLAPEALSHSGAGDPREGLLGTLEGLEPAGEGSLATAVDLIASGLGAEASPQRLVIFTDLGRQCGGDLCSSVSALVEAGVEIDLVLVGDAAAPDCVERFVFQEPGPLQSRSLPEPVAFRVETRGAQGGELRASGVADGEPVPLRSGNAYLILDLDPPEEIGPLFFAPTARTRVRVLEFPHLGRGVREVHSQTLAIGGEAS